DQVRKMITLTKKIGIETLAYFMIGSPTETRDDISRTIDFALELKPDFVHITILCPFPETAIYTRGLKEGIFKKDHWREFARNPTPDFKPPYWNENFSDRELQELLISVYKKFYTRPFYIIRKMGRVRSLSEFIRKAKAGLKVFGMKKR
ncbi:MAG: hypothetical protein P9M08_13220, partial [Candidatus Erginobacter occultus]|nr:hypothetical protein [Candidatus Erginobacter occultus]